MLLSTTWSGRGNSTVVSVSVCQAGHPGLHPARSACFRKVEFYQFAIELFCADGWFNVHVLSCLCDNACKRSLAICCKSRASCPVSLCLSLYGLHVLNRDFNMIQTNKITIYRWTVLDKYVAVCRNRK